MSFIAAAIILLVWAAFRVRIVPASTIRVIDGDSLMIAGVNCRLRGIDAPEWSQPQGPAATATMRQLIASDRKFIIVSHGRDVYRRHLITICRLAGLQSVNASMVRQGHAFATRPGVLWSAYGSMMIARLARRGMWDTAGLELPWNWRQSHPRKKAA